MTSSIANAEKKKLFEEWLEGDHLLVHFDSRPKEVLVPAHLKDNHALTLKLSRLFQGETTCNDREISSYLKFNGEYFQCIIPWDILWGMTSEEGFQKIWEKDIPREMYRELLRASLKNVGTKLKHSLGIKDSKPIKDHGKSVALSSITGNKNTKPEKTLPKASAPLSLINSQNMTADDSLKEVPTPKEQAPDVNLSKNKPESSGDGRPKPGLTRIK